MSDVTEPALAHPPAANVVCVLLPGDIAPLVADGLARSAAAASRDLGAVEVRCLPWHDTPASRRAKAAGLARGRRRVPERPLDAQARTALADATVVVSFEAPLDLPVLAPGLRFVQSISAGIAPLAGVLAGSGVRVCSAAGLSAGKVAEFALARLFAVWTDHRTLEALQRARRWTSDVVDVTPIAGRTVLVVGTGGIGRALARRAAAFDLRVLGVRRRPALGTPPGFERVVGAGELLEVLPEADAVVLAAPATSATDQLVGREELMAMKRGAVLVNVARGALVDEEALVAALVSGHLGAAVLDVVGAEPLRRQSPLWRAPNTFLSPHVANDWRPPYLATVVDLVVENLAHDLRGEPLRNEVDLAEGY